MTRSVGVGSGLPRKKTFNPSITVARPRRAFTGFHSDNLTVISAARAYCQRTHASPRGPDVVHIGKIFALSVRLTFVCHGATTSNRTATFPGDEPLEGKAVVQTKKLVRMLDRADHVCTSPALRARQTAELLSLDGEPDQILRDCDYGRWSGRTIIDVQAAEPENLAAWMTDATAAPHGGESFSALCERVGSWIDRRLGVSGHTIAITHAAVIRAALLHVLQAPLSTFWKIDVEPLSIVQMSGDGRRWTLRLPSRARGTPRLPSRARGTPLSQK